MMRPTYATHFHLSKLAHYLTFKYLFSEKARPTELPWESSPKKNLALMLKDILFFIYKFNYRRFRKIIKFDIWHIFDFTYFYIN